MTSVLSLVGGSTRMSGVANAECGLITVRLPLSIPNWTDTTGNLLDAKTEALVNTVNTVGVMGKGIALMFKEAFPENFSSYAGGADRRMPSFSPQYARACTRTCGETPRQRAT
jgi:nitrous oxide reductase accessory protein NosL